ncbi:MAG: hypothetical protein K5872_08885 [Rhizobiaceae bacterium]|nr:hypothetical protein [Rhizobiaceae bacterium]MCV0406330.1 hypothetical protein [Rhizobiaceae bacterium]
MHGLSDNLEIRVVGAPVAAGATIDDNSSRIDMADYESVLFIAPITDSVATGVATLTIQSSDADSDDDMADVDGTASTVTSAVNDDVNGTALVSELYHPAKRYVQATRTSATANIAYGSVIAILTPRQRPAVQGATISDTAYAAN